MSTNRFTPATLTKGSRTIYPFPIALLTTNREGKREIFVLPRRRRFEFDALAFTSEYVHFPNCSKRFLLFGNREKKRFAGEASYSSVSGRSSHSPPPPPPRSSRSHRIMEMRLAPILILYYFPAEFSRHLYDNAKKIFPSPQKNPSGVAATPRPRIILPPPRSITLASLPNRAHLPPSPSIVSPLEYASSVSRVDLVSPPPPPPQFSSPHHQSPKQMTRSRRRYPPRHRSSPRLSDIRIFLSMPAPSHTLPRISPCSSTTLDLRRSQISAQNVERRKFTSGARDTGRERERETLLFKRRVYYDSSIPLDGHLPPSLYSPPSGI